MICSRKLQLRKEIKVAASFSLRKEIKVAAGLFRRNPFDSLRNNCKTNFSLFV